MDNADYKWNDLPVELLVHIAGRLPVIEDYIRFTSVSKSWKSVTQEAEKPRLQLRYPLLLLAEQVAPGTIIHCDFDDNDIYKDTESHDYEEEDTDVHGEDDEDSGSDGGETGSDNENENTDSHNDESDDDKQTSSDDEKKDTDSDEDDDCPLNTYDHKNNSVGITRGLYSLSTGKAYNIQLPEAAGRLILGTNKGWLLTLGRDFQINLLHPLFRHQFPLPSMLTFPKWGPFWDTYLPEDIYDRFFEKVAMSSSVPTENTAVMAIYGECGYLGFLRLGDKVWTDVNVPSRSFHDVIYYKGSFYAVDNCGNVFVCSVDQKGELMGTKIASLNKCDEDRKYLVEPSTGSCLLIVVRTYNQKFATSPHRLLKYRTTNFSVWKLELEYSESNEILSRTLIKENNLRNQALFVGRASSLSVPSSETIKSNCIYFTDDNWVTYYRQGGGHDMGIFNLESNTIETHFQGESLHPISPPLWYN